MDEYISREALLAEIAADYGNWIAYNDTDESYRQGVNDNYSDTIRLINDIPAADVQPVKHGKWENDKLDIPRCSCCSYIPEFNRHIDDYYYSDFCPNCGARMGGGSE